MSLKQSIKNGTAVVSIYHKLARRKWTISESDNLIGLYERLICFEKFKSKYSYVVENFTENKEEKLSKKSNYIWFCWWQGIENAPEIVQLNYKNLIRLFPDKTVVMLDEKNYSDYISFPEWFVEKWKKGIIDNTKASNLLRIELLDKFGGLWIDSTVYISSAKLPRYIFDVPFFMYVEDGIGEVRTGATWLMSSYTNNPLLQLTRDLYLEYWKNENTLMEYFLITFCLKMAKERFTEIWDAMPKIPADNQIMLAKCMFDPYDEEYYKDICDITNVHKLSFKEKKELYALDGTFYKHILNDMRQALGQK